MTTRQTLKDFLRNFMGTQQDSISYNLKTEDGMIIDSLVHNSELSHEHVENPKNLVNIGSEHLLEIIPKLTEAIQSE